MAFVAPTRLMRTDAPPVFTVHDRRTGWAYSLRHERNAAVVVFRTNIDAYAMSRALEHYANQNDGRYPPHDVFQHPRALELLRPAPLSFRDPKHLYARMWPALTYVLETCANNGLDVMVCTNLTMRPHVRVSGQVHELVDCALGESYADFLNNKLLLE
jgi:hypothetical protein